MWLPKDLVYEGGSSGIPGVYQNNLRGQTDLPTDKASDIYGFMQIVELSEYFTRFTAYITDKGFIEHREPRHEDGPPAQTLDSITTDIFKLRGNLAFRVEYQKKEKIKRNRPLS
ncbi:hypothetical protein AOL_s00176g89 [Orbilia oligospora ATCC 24927]|uniref:Uncharacterized protein n=2 Tax=Orbilia oligospora TaxID=2813651 RepID=G1XPW4_ARTOA|nr:hypothetical protein AOL_s00176g89 [Orbilia oligospora ATCC 24927]EGX44807.1 hypothetical protein AOL_s00176g89 [Orbilia oligospora ATCC 24927]KAF3284196.1 hypothetical protein TWF970_011415 [Orbilia oligospora]